MIDLTTLSQLKLEPIELGIEMMKSQALPLGLYIIGTPLFMLLVYAIVKKKGGSISFWALWIATAVWLAIATLLYPFLLTM